MEGNTLDPKLDRRSGRRFVIVQTKINSHVGEDTMERYVLGHLPVELSSVLEEHVILCETCQTRLEQIEEYVRIAAAAGTELQADAKAVAPWYRDFSWLAIPKPVWAGALALLMLSVAIPIYRSLDGQTEEVSMKAVRGPVAHASHGKLVLRIDTSTIQHVTSFQIELVRANGEIVWQGPADASNNQLRLPFPTKIDPGWYSVRLYSRGSSDLL